MLLLLTLCGVHHHDTEEKKRGSLTTISNNFGVSKHKLNRVLKHWTNYYAIWNYFIYHLRPVYQFSGLFLNRDLDYWCQRKQQLLPGPQFSHDHQIVSSIQQQYALINCSYSLHLEEVLCPHVWLVSHRDHCFFHRCLRWQQTDTVGTLNRMWLLSRSHQRIRMNSAPSLSEARGRSQAERMSGCLCLIFQGVMTLFPVVSFASLS